MLDTLRSRLLVILLLFSICTILITVAAFRYFVDCKDSLSEVTGRIENAHVLLLKDIKVMHNFFENETINPSFFRTGKSPLLDEHNELCRSIHSSLNELYDLQRLNEFNLSQSLSSFKVAFNQYDELTNTIISQILLRGFKDFGTEGRMRKHAHALEIHEKEIGLINILQLRRHEKDFIIRHEEQYIDLHSQLIMSLQKLLESNKSISNSKKREIAILLNNYATCFKTLVHYEKKLGLKTGSGLKKQVDLISDKLEMNLASMVETSKLKEATILEHIKFVYIIVACLFLVISFLFSGLISKKVFSSITYLRTKMDEFVSSGFSKRTILPISNSSNEIDMLTTNFSIMEQHIVDQMDSLKQTNKDLEMLIYATSNDLQLPLNEVKKLTEAASCKVADQTAREYFDKISSSWQQLLNIIDELSIITNVRKVQFRPELIDPEELIRSVFSEFRTLTWFDNIIFSLEIRLSTQFYSSKGLLKVIFRNLIENAIKYATKRPTFSFLKISISNENDEMVRVVVADNGVGIKKENQDRIFDMFYRGTDYTTGTGLGLYIVRNSLEKLNGTISFISDENTGTTFTLLIPNHLSDKNIKEQFMYKREMDRVSNLIG